MNAKKENNTRCIAITIIKEAINLIRGKRYQVMHAMLLCIISYKCCLICVLHFFFSKNDFVEIYNKCRSFFLSVVMVIYLKMCQKIVCAWLSFFSFLLSHDWQQSFPFFLFVIMSRYHKQCTWLVGKYSKCGQKNFLSCTTFSGSRN